MSKKLLKHVEAITCHRDTALLDKSVVSSLRELLQIEEIRLYDVAHRGDDALIAMTTWSDATGIHCRHDGLHDDDYEPVPNHPGIAACIDANDKVPGDAAQDARHQLLMICVDRKPIACCEITYPEAPTSQQRDLAEGILGLYRNYLSLLEDSQIDTLTGQVVQSLQPGKAILHMEFTPRGEHVWLSARDDNKVVIYDTGSFAKIGEFAAQAPSGIFFTSRANRTGF